MKTQAAIIGGGPSGLLLSQLLYTQGIDSIVLERKTKDYVLGRIRAGVLEQGLVQMMEEAGCADRMKAEGFPHDGTEISYGEEIFRIDFAELTGTPVMVYGQTEVTRDLYEAREKSGGQIEYKVEAVVIHDAKSDAPFVTFTQDGQERRIDKNAGSTATISRAVTGFTACRAKPSRIRCAKSMKRFTPSAGLACCRKRLR